MLDAKLQPGWRSIGILPSAIVQSPQANLPSLTSPRRVTSPASLRYQATSSWSNWETFFSELSKRRKQVNPYRKQRSPNPICSPCHTPCRAGMSLSSVALGTKSRFATNFQFMRADFFLKRGLGALVAQKFAAEGSNVAINYMSNKETADKVAADLASKYSVKTIVVQGV